MKRVTATAGGVFVALQTAATVVAGPPPAASDPLRTIIGHYRDHRNRLVASDYLFAISALPFLIFVTGLRNRYAEVESDGGVRGDVAHAAGVAGALLLIIDAAIEATLTEAASDHRGPRLVANLFGLSRAAFGFTFIPMCLLTSGAMGWPGQGATHRWFRRFSAGVSPVLGVAPAYAFTGSRFMTRFVGFAYLTFLVWTAAASLQLHFDGGKTSTGLAAE